MTNSDLDGKVALVTGSAHGVGRAICEALARRGALVVASDVDSSALQETGRMLGPGHHMVVKDLRPASGVRELVAETVRLAGGLDIVVNNAADLRTGGPITECSEEEYDTIMALNARAPFFATQCAIPVMLERGGGSIVNVASALALVGKVGYGAYVMSKGALLQLTRQVAVDYASRGIRCNAVCPGVTDSRHLRDQLAASEDPETMLSRLAQGSPLGRIGMPEEVAEVVAFLTSYAASYMHGAVVSVDGGYLAW